VGRRGAVATCDIEHREALDDVVARLPLVSYFVRLEIEPLERAEEALATARRQRRSFEALRSLRRARHNGSAPETRPTHGRALH
jgi:hypothetical protein